MYLNDAKIFGINYYLFLILLNFLILFAYQMSFFNYQELYLCLKNFILLFFNIFYFLK